MSVMNSYLIPVYEYDPNEWVSLKYVCLFSSQSTENELIHPNNTNGKKILDTAGPSVVKWTFTGSLCITAPAQMHD